MPVLPASYKSVEELTDALSDFLQTPLVRQITGGIHVNDAFIYDAWDKLPPEWTAYWDADSQARDHRFIQQDMIDSIDDGEGPCPADTTAAQGTRVGEGSIAPPASLVRWLGQLRAVSLPRARRQGPVLALPEALTVHMKTKKINEVSVAAAYIHRVCHANNLRHVIDMGSGQGYLSVALAYLFPSLRILAIDGSASQVAGSRALASAVGIPEGGRLRHLVRHVDGSAALAEEMEGWAGGGRCVLVGLHACGRLSEHMLRYFAGCACVSHVAAVGCCYNHIAMRSDGCPDGFPVSERLRARGVTLSPTALMTGCQAPNNWERRPAPTGGASAGHARRQFYRALLEKMLHDKGVQVGTGGTAGSRPNWGIRKGDLGSFERFTSRALHCLGAGRVAGVSRGDIEAYEARYAGQEGRIAILWTLGVLCCKAVESIIALDRYWYLVEHAAEKVDIVPIFEYKGSPRNLMIVAEKRDAASS